MDDLQLLLLVSVPLEVQPTDVILLLVLFLPAPHPLHLLPHLAYLLLLTGHQRVVIITGGVGDLLE